MNQLIRRVFTCVAVLLFFGCSLLRAAPQSRGSAQPRAHARLDAAPRNPSRRWPVAE